MKHRIEEEDDDWDDGEWDDADAESDEGEPTIPCPYCRQEICEDSLRCPHCGQYISAEDSPPGRKSWWIIIGVLLCLAAIIVWILQSL
jgi:hypothetical protein